MTRDCQIAAAWAIRYFDVEQFKHIKDHKEYSFPWKRR